MATLVVDLLAAFVTVGEAFIKDPENTEKRGRLQVLVDMAKHKLENAGDARGNDDMVRLEKCMRVATCMLEVGDDGPNCVTPTTALDTMLRASNVVDPTMQTHVILLLNDLMKLTHPVPPLAEFERRIQHACQQHEGMEAALLRTLHQSSLADAIAACHHATTLMARRHAASGGTACDAGSG